MENSAWQIEDTFFGALLGAFLGTFIDSLSLWDVILLIGFSALFPALFRKYSTVIKSSNVLSVSVGLWIGLFAFNLYSQKILSDDKALVLVVLLVVWFISKIFSSTSKQDG